MADEGFDERPSFQKRARDEDAPADRDTHQAKRRADEADGGSVWPDDQVRRRLARRWEHVRCLQPRGLGMPAQLAEGPASSAGDNEGIGARLLRKMGYEVRGRPCLLGLHSLSLRPALANLAPYEQKGGLGARGQGISAPIAATGAVSTAGLGFTGGIQQVRWRQRRSRA